MLDLGRFPLRTRLITASVAVIVASFGVATAITVFAGNRTLRGFADRELQLQAERGLTEVDRELRELGEEIARWARSRAMDDVLIDDTHLRVENFLLEHLRELPGRIRSLTVVDDAGQVIASTDFERLGTIVTLPSFALFPVGSGDLRRSRFPGQPGQDEDVLAFAHPITTPFSTRSVGWLVAEIEWDPIRKLLVPFTSRSANGHLVRYVALQDQGGRIIVQDPALPAEGPPVDTDRYMVASVPARGESSPMIAGLHAVARWNTWDAYSLNRVHIVGVLSAALLGMLLAIFASILIARGISRRVQDLDEGTRRVAQGDYDLELPENGRDELASLARSFNLMGHRLSAARESSAAATARWRSLVEHAPDIIVTVSKEGMVEFLNRTVEGYRLEDVVGSSLTEWILPDYRAELETEIAKVMRTGNPASVEVEGVGPGVSVAHYSIRIGPVVREGVVAGVNLIATDITDRRRLEREILTVSEQERKRIGQDIHDGIGQALSGAALLCRSLARSLAAKDSANSGQATRIAELLESTVAEARAVARGVFPLDLSAQGLYGALESLAESVDAVDGISCRVEGEASPATFTEMEATHLYRIAQEAVNNALRHAQAKSIVIRVLNGSEARGIDVENDGAPFRVRPGGTGLGIQLMRYRAAMIGGSLHVDVSDGGGTRVRCRL